MKKRNAFLAFLLSAAIGLSLPLLAGGQSYWPPSIGDYDGSSDYLSRNSDLAGNADGKTATFSVWARIDGGNGSNRLMLTSTANALQIGFLTTNVWRILGLNSSAGTILNISSSAITASSTWLNILCSVDLTNAAKRHIYINDVADLATVTTYTNDEIDYTRATWNLGSSAGATIKWNGALSEFWLDLTSYMDFSVEANRRKFISASGDPVYLGVTGGIPTGTAPIIYMKTRANNAGINSGTGGDFNINGAPLYSDGPFPFFPLTVQVPDRGMGSRIH